MWMQFLVLLVLAIVYYACWIRQYMNRALNNDFKSIRLPANKEEKIKKIKRFSIDFYKKNGRDPKNSEISEAIKS